MLNDTSSQIASQNRKQRSTGCRRDRSQPWGEHRALIKRLYIDEDKSLAITRHIMKEDHGFDASYVI